MRSLAVLGLVIACSSRQPDPASKDDARTAARRTDAAPTPDAAVDAASCEAGVQIPNGACATNADCVLTDIADACDACNLAQPYPAPRAAFDLRTARCASTPPCTTGCPPHDTYIPAFYRAECRDHRCLAWRYHSGG